MWYFTKDNTQEGPFDEQAIAATVAAGTIAGDTFVWRDGMPEWLPLNKTDLARLLPQRPAPPPLPTTPPPLSESSPAQRKPWFKRTWVHVLLLIFLPFVQVPLMWVLKVFSLRTRIILSVVGFILTIARFAPHSPDSTATSDSSHSSSSAPAERAQTQETISWSEINSIYNIKSRDTDLQKKEQWKRFKGKRVNWSGEVASISDGFGGLTLQIKMNSSAFVSDLLIRLKRSERAKALRLQKGDSVTFSGKLDDWGTLMPITLDDGELQ